MTFEILPDDAPVKLCRDCRFYHDGIAQCRAEGNRKAPDYVNGGFIFNWQTAQPVRMTEKDCGPTAAWFEPRPPYDND